MSLCLANSMLNTGVNAVSFRDRRQNARDQIAFSAFHCILSGKSKGMRWNLATFEPHIANSNLDSRIASSSWAPQ